jgi:hypothetical protein
LLPYFGRSEKTVRRWEETEGLPVHRLLHEKRSVYGYTGELDVWREARRAPIKAEPAPSDAEAKVNSQKIAVVPSETAEKRTKLLGRIGRPWLIALIIAATMSLTGLLAGIFWVACETLSYPEQARFASSR